MTGQKVLKRLVRGIQPALQGLPLERSRCILTTAIGVDVLAAFGITARPLSVRADLVNAAWVAWANEGYPDGEAGGKTRGAWRLTGGDPDLRAALGRASTLRRPWDGHLVVEVPVFQGFLDLDLQQMNRPERNISVPPAAAFVWGTRDPLTGLGTTGTYGLPDGSFLRYDARRDDQTWQVAPDWTEPARRDAIVRDLIKGIRKGTIR